MLAAKIYSNAMGHAKYHDKGSNAPESVHGSFGPHDEGQFHFINMSGIQTKVRLVFRILVPCG